MAKHVKRSVLPIYLVGFFWLGYALLFSLRSAGQYLLCAALVGMEIQRYRKPRCLRHELSRRIRCTDRMLRQNATVCYAKLHHKLLFPVMCHERDVHTLLSFLSIIILIISDYIQNIAFFQRLF